MLRDLSTPEGRAFWKWVDEEVAVDKEFIIPFLHRLDKEPLVTFLHRRIAETDKRRHTVLVNTPNNSYSTYAEGLIWAFNEVLKQLEELAK